jgi:ATPase subunit of ABC transporter with duplicated ATPase domains
MISLSEVAMRFGAQVLFENVTWRLHPGSHYGLVGANGTGKSTLLKLMTGELKPEAGVVSRPNALRLGVLGQDHFRYDELPLLEVVMMGRPRLWQALQEKRALLARGGGEEQLAEADGHRLGELEGIIADNGGYTAEALAGTLLAGLGLPEDRHARPMRELSGGYRLRVLLGQTLFQQPELLLLDEPTNHLDIVSIRWLEAYLREFPGTLVLVSHDRHFLNTICDHIADVDYQEVRIYPGNYNRFEQGKALATTQKEKGIARAEKKIAEMQQFIDRFRAKATKARQAQSRQKQVERIEMPEITRSSRRHPVFAFTPERASGREVVTAGGLAKGFSGRPVLQELELEVRRGDKLAVVGPNGIGKTTLLKLIVGELQPDAGSVETGYEVRSGYFSQDHDALQRARGSAFDWLYALSPHKEIGTVRGLLGKVLFSGEEADKPVAALSGGEATRLRLAALMARGENLLVLDEPTNHLDLEGREALMKALIAYPGTLMFVSHDRHFVSSVATRVLALSPDRVDDFHGSYEEYLAREGADFLTLEGAASAAPASQDPERASAAALDYEQRKARKRDLARLRKTVGRLEREIAGLEREIEGVDARFAEKDYYDKTSWEEIEKDERTKKEARRKLEATLAAWEAAAGELESLQDVG